MGLENRQLVEQLNDLLSEEGRAGMKREAAAELVARLAGKRDALRQNFVANLPSNYSNEKEFVAFLNRAEAFEKRLQQMAVERDSMCAAIEDELKVESECEAEFGPMVLKAIGIKRQLAYVKCLAQIHQLKSELCEELGILESSALDFSRRQPEKSATERLNFDKEYGALIEKAIGRFILLRTLLESLAHSKCFNLLDYLVDSVIVVHKKLKQIVMRELEDKLKMIGYPFVGSEGGLELKDEANRDSGEERVKECARWLMRIDLEPVLERNSVYVNDRLGVETESNYSLLIAVFSQPFEKRFKFHFLGTRKTNNLEKPEWYLSQILKWIKQHEEFLHNVVPTKLILIDFSNSLLNLIKAKIDSDLTTLVQHQALLSHTIDELLLFDAQLKALDCEQLPAGKETLGCLHILCENAHLFTSWINLERQVCQKKLDAMFADLNRLSSTGERNASKADVGLLSAEKALDDIWACSYSDVDKMKPPHCAETFMAMIKAITDRCRVLPYQSKKLQFVSLQVELIKDFHMRLCQIFREEVKSPFGKSFLGVLNAVNYILNILDEWKNSTFYIEMHYLKLKYNQIVNKMKGEEEGESDEGSEAELCAQFDQKFANFDPSIYTLNSLFDINGTLFDEVLADYEKVRDEMLDTINKNCMWEIETRSRNYKKEKWAAMPLFSEYFKPTLSQSAADMLVSLRNILYLLRDSLATSLFESIIKKLSFRLDYFVYEEIILKNQFNEGGIAQIDYDFNKYLLPIFIEFSADLKLETFFRKTKEALILLNSKQGSAILLRDTISSAIAPTLDPLSTDESLRMNQYKARNALKEFGIVKLTCNEALQVLDLRSYKE